MGLLFAIAYFLFCITFSWVRCIWCGQWFPFWGKASWPRKPWQCKRCGRQF